jgi:NitT/TauT family transport system substrate-binding protein
VAPWYIAEELLRAEGFTDIRYVPGALPTLMIGRGEIDFALVDAASIVFRLDTGVPITALAGVHVGCFELFAGDHIRTISDLKGKSVGVSAPNSSTHFGLKALQQAANMPDADVKLVAIGTTEVEALIQKRIDAAMTFLPNESAQMNSLGFSVETIAVADYLNLVPPGFVVGDKLVKDHPEVVQRFVNATLRGLRDVPAMNQLITSKLTERLTRTANADLVRLAGLDQRDLRELRRQPPRRPAPAASEPTPALGESG